MSIDYSDMAFPKPEKKKTVKVKKRKPNKYQHPKSIMQKKGSKVCMLCMLLEHNLNPHNYLEEHHVFCGVNRRNSESYGLKVYLCEKHHTYGENAVHQNKEVDLMLRRLGQQAFERKHTREEFMRIFGKNYL